MPVVAFPRARLTLLVLLLGLAAFVSTTGLAPTLGGALPVLAASTTTERAAPASADVEPEPEPSPAPQDSPAAEGRSAPEPAASPTSPPLRRLGTTADGWAAYRLESGRLPDRLATGATFRGDISWLQGGQIRKARVFVPASAGANAPLLISLHGLSTSLRKVEEQQRWSPLSKQQGFVLVWGAGYRASWNAGPCCGAAVTDKIDDLAYLDQLLAVVRALHGIDPRRIDLAGFSNGAMLAYRYACGRPGLIAGVLAVSGTLAAPCVPSNPTAVLAVHGALDPTVPLAGRSFSQELHSTLPPARRAADQWNSTGAGVRLVVLPNFAHGWPTLTNGGYDTTNEGWRFLRDHARP